MSKPSFGQGRQEPASANEGGHRPRACDKPWRSRPTAFESATGSGTTMRRANKTSWASRAAGSKGQEARKPKTGSNLLAAVVKDRSRAASEKRQGGLGGQECCLTLHSRGGPTACHQARATERVRLLSVARAWRPTVGLPLSSNVRQHTRPPSAFACFGRGAIQDFDPASSVNEQAKFWSGPAGAGQCKRRRPQAAST
jgi:hypothetical protein